MPEVHPLRRQLTEIASIHAALDAGEPVRVLLALRDSLSTEAEEALRRAKATGAKLYRTTVNDLRRMSAHLPAPGILAMVGPDPSMSLKTLLVQPGVTWLLSKPSYASNVGFAIRAAEVSGADGIVIDSAFSNAQREQALRVSMGAHRFLPVHWENSEDVIQCALEQGKHIFALEDVGERPPWEADLTKPSLLVVGNERTGIPETVLEQCTAVLRLPMPGFVPSYNLQAVVAAVASERLRQLATTTSEFLNQRPQ